MRHQVGEKSLSIWLEFLSIADRNQGEIPGDLDELIRSVAGKCQATKRTVRGVYDFATSRLWFNYQPTLRTRNHWKYHRTEERKPAPSEPDQTRPDHKEDKNPPPQEAIRLAQLLSDRIFENNPKRTAPTETQLMKWSRDADLMQRKDGHTWEQIQAVLEWSQRDSFWKANILSMGKLREKWNQLSAKMGGSPNGQGNHDTQPKGIAALQEWRRLRGLNS